MIDNNTIEMENHSNQQTKVPMRHVESVMELASNEGLNDMVEIMRSGADINLSHELYKETPLHMAVRKGSPKLVNMLLDAGAKLDSEDRLGLSPFHLACSLGRPEIVCTLLDRGAPPDGEGDCIRPGMASPLILAIDSNSVEIVKLLLQYGASVNASDYWNNSPLLTAVRAGRPAIVDVLLQNGGDVNKPNNYGMSPIPYSIESGQCHLVHTLLKHGPDYSCSKLHPLVVAVRVGCMDCFKCTLESEVNISESGGCTLRFALTNHGWEHTEPAPTYKVPSNLSTSRIEFALDLLNHGVSVETVWRDVLFDTTGDILIQSSAPAYELCIRAYGRIGHNSPQELKGLSSMFRCFAKEKLYSLLKLLVTAGYTPSNEDLDFVRKREQSSEFLNLSQGARKDFDAMLAKMDSLRITPRSLMNLSVLAVRKCIYSNVLYKARQLRLSATLEIIVTLREDYVKKQNY